MESQGYANESGDPGHIGGNLRNLRTFDALREFFENRGPTGFDSKTNGYVSMPSAGAQLVNLMIRPF